MKGSRQGYASGFDPRSIDRCALWLDAADRSTLTFFGSNVTTWADKSGNGNNATQPTASLAPTYSATALNSQYPGLVFTSSGFTAGFTNTPSNLTFMRFPNLQSGTNDASYFAVFQASNTAQIIRNYKTQYNVTYSINTGTIEVICASTFTGQLYAGYTRTVAPMMVSFSFTSGNTITLTGGLNGTMTTVSSNVTPPASTTDNDPLGVIGCYTENPNYYDSPLIGTISELIIFNSALTTAQRQAVEGYLARKWGLQSSTSLLSVGHPYKYGTPGFVPTSISNCALWLDAADASTLTLSGSNVTAWADKSGSNVSLSLIGTSPVYSSNQVVFNGASRFEGSYTYATQSTVFVLYTTTNTTTNTRLIDINGNGYGNLAAPASDSVVASIFADAFIWTGGTNYPAHSLYTSLAPQTGTRVYSIVYNGTNSLIWRNGTAQTLIGSGFAGTANGTMISIGAGVGSGVNGWIGSLAEVIIYKSNLTTAQRQQVEGYLAWKWGVRTPTLPATHPYVSIPPVLRPFAPLDVPGCALWLDAADPNTFTRANVTQWRDKSGSNNHLNAVGTFSNAVVSPSFQNGRSVLNFTGNNIYRSVSNAVYPSDCYIVLALKSIARADFIGIGNTTSDAFNSLTFGEFTAARWHNGSSGFLRTPNAVSPTNETSTGFLLMNWSLANNNFLIRRNGTQLVQTNSYTFSLGSPSAFQLGSRITHLNTLDVSFNAYIAEIVVYNSQLATSNQQTVEGYLAWKWGLQGNLPAGHPFLSAAPSMTSPTSIAGCSLWLDAADGTTTVATNVTAWNDKSGSNVVLSATSNFPRYGTAQINGVPALEFPGSSNRLEGAYTYATQSAIFMVYNTSNTTSASRLFDVNSNGYGNFAGPWITPSTPAVNSDLLLWLGGSNYPAQALYTTLTPQTGTRLYCAQFNGTSSAIWRNGDAQTLTGSGFAGPANGTRISIGGGVGNGGDPFTGTVGEVLVYKAVLTTAQRQAIEGYLARKWGLQRNLSSGHPYQFGLPPLTAGFTPVAISGCALWLDAADRTSLTLSGSNVTQWNDKSGNGRNAVSAGAVLPTYSSSSFNGAYPGVTMSNYTFSFNSNDNRFEITIPTNTFSSGITCVSVFRPTTSATNYWMSRPTAGAIPYPIDSYTSPSFNRRLIGNGTNYWEITMSGGYSFLTQSNTLYCFQAGPSVSWSEFVNGTSSPVTGSIFSNGVVTYSDAGSSALRIYLQGIHCEHILFNGTLTTSQRQQVEGYLAHKWGLVASLPATHPYRLIKP